MVASLILPNLQHSIRAAVLRNPKACGHIPTGSEASWPHDGPGASSAPPPAQPSKATWLRLVSSAPAVTACTSFHLNRRPAPRPEIPGRTMAMAVGAADVAGGPAEVPPNRKTGEQPKTRCDIQRAGHRKPPASPARLSEASPASTCEQGRRARECDAAEMLRKMMGPWRGQLPPPAARVILEWQLPPPAAHYPPPVGYCRRPSAPASRLNTPTLFPVCLLRRDAIHGCSPHLLCDCWSRSAG